MIGVGTTAFRRASLASHTDDTAATAAATAVAIAGGCAGSRGDGRSRIRSSRYRRTHPLELGQRHPSHLEHLGRSMRQGHIICVGFNGGQHFINLILAVEIEQVGCGADALDKLHQRCAVLRSSPSENNAVHEAPESGVNDLVGLLALFGREGRQGT